MTTVYGKLLRKIRIDHDELLKDMATKLNITSAYLSSIENGKRNVPIQMTKNIADIYQLDNAVVAKLEAAEDQLRTGINFNISVVSDDKKDMVLALARRFDDISEEEITKIRKILREGDM